MAKRKTATTSAEDLPKGTVPMELVQYALGLSDKAFKKMCSAGLPISGNHADIRECVAWYLAHKDDEQRKEDSDLALSSLRSVANGSESAVAQVNAAKALLEHIKLTKPEDTKDIEVFAFIEIQNVGGVIEATKVHASCPKCGLVLTDD